jgi:hypothetical protein
MPLSNLAESPPFAIRRRGLVLAAVVIAGCFTIGIAAYSHFFAWHHHHHVYKAPL